MVSMDYGRLKVGYVESGALVPATFSLVGVLLFHGSPLAIGWFVMSIVINALDGIFLCWSIAHIGKKIGKAIFPSGANLHAAPTPIWITVMSWIEASILHVEPNGVFRSFVQAVFLHPKATFVTSLCEKFASQAPATICHSVNKGTSHYLFFYPAVASANPVGSFIDCSRGVNYGQSPKSFTKQISFLHTLRYNTLCVQMQQN